jgi:hypothetical protein
LHNDLLSEVVTVRGVRPTGGRINALPSRSLDDGFLRFVWNKSHGNSLKEGMDQRERGRERHRERERETETERERQRERHRERDRDRDREGEVQTKRERDERRRSSHLDCEADPLEENKEPHSEPGAIVI